MEGTVAIAAAKVAIEVAHRGVEYLDLKRKTNPEIAFVVELKKSIKTKSPDIENV